MSVRVVNEAVEGRREAGVVHSMVGATPEAESSGEEQEQLRRQARRHYHQALYLTSSLDYPAAAALMEEAVMWHPTADYFSLLGCVLERDPTRWVAALESYRQAVELRAGDPRLRLQMARLLERMGRTEAARRVYGAALTLSPGHEVIRAACRRLDRQMS